MAKRGDRVAPPPQADEWELVFGTSEAAHGWEELTRQAPGPTRQAFDALSRDPRDTARLGRQHRLQGTLGTVRVAGDDLQQWQYEVTAGGRVWYAVDDKRRRLASPTRRRGTGRRRSRPAMCDHDSMPLTTRPTSLDEESAAVPDGIGDEEPRRG